MPACGTVVGSSLEFGVSDDEAVLTTQSVSVTNKSDKKEARDGCGIVVAVAYYNLMSDISIECLGTEALLTIGGALSLAGTFAVAGAIFVDEMTVSKSNEDFVKTSIKATSYAGIATS